MDKRGEEFEKVLDVLKSGIEIEARGIKFYKKAAESVKDPRGRQTMEFLEKEEREHQRFIKDLKRSYERGGNASSKEIIKSHFKTDKTRIFPDMKAYVENVKDSRGDEKILSEAEDIEKRSISFYRKSSKGIKNKEYKKVFEVLIREEEEHLKLIEQMNDYMTLHGVWSGLEDYFANE